MRAFLGRPVFVSLTLTKANCIRPSEKSSIRSTSSPSTTSQPRVKWKRLSIPLTSRALYLEHTFLVSCILKGICQRSLDREDSPLTVRGRRGCSASWWRGIDYRLVALRDRRPICGKIERCHAGDRNRQYVQTREQSTTDRLLLA